MVHLYHSGCRWDSGITVKGKNDCKGQRELSISKQYLQTWQGHCAHELIVATTTCKRLVWDKAIQTLSKVGGRLMKFSPVWGDFSNWCLGEGESIFFRDLAQGSYQCSSRWPHTPSNWIQRLKRMRSKNGQLLVAVNWTLLLSRKFQWGKRSLKSD